MFSSQSSSMSTSFVPFTIKSRARHILIVPDADLFYLPFEAIIDADAKLDWPADSLA